MSDLGEAERFGTFLELSEEAHFESLRLVAFPADEMVVMVAGDDQLKQVSAVFERNFLEDADRFEGLHGAVNRDEIGFGKAGTFADFNRRFGAVKVQKSLKDSPPLLGDS